MSVNTIGPKQRWKGLSTDEKPAANPGDEFFETDTRIRKEYDGTAWVQTHSGGAALVSDAALDYIPYSDATYDYYCEAAPGTALATAAWRIVRKHRSTGHWQHADGGAFSNAATDLATVQGAFA